MSYDWQRLSAIGVLAAIGIGILIVMAMSVLGDSKVSGDDAGWITAGFLSLREVMGKIENITLGIRTPAPPTQPIGN